MAQELPLDLYRWLAAHQVVQQAKPVFRPNGKCQIEANIANQLSNGVRVAKLIMAIIAEKSLNADVGSLASLKNSSTPASRLYNWNVLTEALEAVGFTLAKAIQKEILTGSFSALVEFLIRLMKRMAPPIAASQSITKEKQEEKKPKMPAGEKELNIDKMNPSKPPEQATSLLEIIILVAGQSLELPPKQVLALLGDGCNYFAHLLVKGVKGSYGQLLTCLNKFRELSEKFVELLRADSERNLEFMLQLLKPGLLSKSEDLVKCTVKLLIDIFELLKNGTDQWLFKELCKQSTLFETIHLSLRRHPHLTAEASQLIFCISEGSLGDFFVIYFRKSAHSDSEYLKAVLLLLDSLTANQQHRKLVESSGIVISWLKLGEVVTNSVNEPTDSKVFATQLMCRLCLQFPQLVEEAEPSFETLLEILKKHSRSDSQVLRIVAINRLFEMLEHTARSRSRYAPLLYKKMIFLYLENHHETEIREVVLLSFNRIFQEFPTIPVDLIVQPFVRQLQLAEGSTYLLNIFDVAFIRELVGHPKLSVKSACTLADFLMKLYLRNLVFSKMLFKCISALVQRYCQSEDFQEVLVRQSREYLTAYYALTQKRNRKAQQDATILSGQKRSLIVEMLKLIIQLEETSINDKLKVMIGQNYSNLIETKKYNDKGLFTLLSIFGIPEALVEQIRSQEKNEFKDSEPAEVPALTHKASPQRKNDTLKRNYTNPKSLVAPSPLTPEPDKQFSEQALLKQHNIGYKNQKLVAATKAINRSADNLKPDDKVLNEIQKIKLKFTQQQTKLELIKLEEQRKQQWNREATRGEILQKNISLGFSKVGDATGRVLYEFGSVKQAALPSHLQLVKLEEEEDRDCKSVELTIKRQARVTKLLFNIFSNTSQAARRQAGIQQEDQLPYISFTETIRLLKDWNMGKLPSKIIVSEIMKQLNSNIKKDRNVLMGVSEEHFPELLTQFTAVLDTYDPQTRLTTVPLGFKLEQLFNNISEGEIQKFDEAQEITAMSNFQKNGEVPAGYKKVTETVMELRSTVRVDLPEPYKVCIEVVDDLLRTMFGTGPIERWADTIEKIRIKKIESKFKPRQVESAVDIRRNKTQQKLPQYVKEKPETNREDELKQQRRQQRLKRAKIELEEQRAKKMQEDAAAKRKQKEEQLEKDKKKQLQRKKEIEEKKEQLKQHKLKLDEEKELKQKEKKQHEESEQGRKKEQREKFFRKQKEKLKEEFQQRGMKAKEGTVTNQKKKHEQEAKKEQLAKKMNSIIAEDKKVKQKQHQQNRAIKELLQEGQVRTLVDKHDSELKAIFKHYSELAEFKIEKTIKSLDVKGFSTFVKQYGISPELLKLQNCLVVYKHTLREHNVKEGLNYQQFLEILVRLASKSSKLLVKSTSHPEQSPGDNEFDREQNAEQNEEEVTSLSPQIVERLFRHMKLETRRYK